MNSILRMALVALPALTACSLAPDGATGDESAPDEAAQHELALGNRADKRTGLSLPGASFFPEGIAASRSGAFYVGSVGTGAIVRFAPGSSVAETLVPPRDAFGVYGVAVDEDRDLLWACTYDDNLYPAQPAYLMAYDLDTGAEEAAYELPGESGFCNDLTLDDEGNVYATDSIASTIVRLPAGGSALETWSADPAYVADPDSFTLNGIAFDGRRRLYVASYATGELFSVRIRNDGSAAAPQAIAVSPPIEFADGLEVLADGSLLVVENDVGQVSRVRLMLGNHAHKTVVASGLAEPTTAAIHRGSAWVVEGQGSLFYSGEDPSLPFSVKRVPLF